MQIKNLQNIPREKRIKRLIVPSQPGEVILESDLSQAEGMIVAWRAEDKRLIQWYETGVDVHSFTGSIVMEKTITKKDNPKERFVAKKIVHGSNYNMSPYGVAREILDAYCDGDADRVLSIAEARRAQNIYFQNFPKIRTEYQMGIQQELRNNNRVLKSATGFIRKFYTPFGDELFRKAYAHYAQNPVAYITNNAMNVLHRTWLKDHIYMQVHDAVYVSVPKERLQEAAALVKQAMTYPLYIKGRELVIPVEQTFGLNAADMEEINV